MRTDAPTHSSPLDLATRAVMNADLDAVEPLSVPMTVPLLWREALTQSVELSSAAAMRALATAVSLAERPPLINEEAMGMELEVARLHQKTQLLIELLALALARDSSRPAATELQLSGAGLQWQSRQPPPLNSVGAVSIWLHPAAPEPLTWPAEITALKPESDGAVRVQARLLPLSEGAQAVLDRHVFQLHRRAIAEARAQRS